MRYQKLLAVLLAMTMLFVFVTSVSAWDGGNPRYINIYGNGHPWQDDSQHGGGALVNKSVTIIIGSITIKINIPGKLNSKPAPQKTSIRPQPAGNQSQKGQ